MKKKKMEGKGSEEKKRQREREVRKKITKRKGSEDIWRHSIRSE